MRILILLAFAMIANVFAGEIQEIVCGDKSLSYCINHFDRQCEAKNYDACGIVGGLYAEQKQYNQAKKYYEIVCDSANGKDTFQVENIYGIAVELSILKLVQTSCSDLGSLYYNGYGVRQSYEKAFQYLKKACDLGYGDGCAGVGFAYYNGKGVKKDLESAIKFLAKSCDLGSGAGCGSLGIFYEGGEGVTRNLSKAKEFFGKACDLGEQKGCDLYKRLKEKGY